MEHYGGVRCPQTGAARAKVGSIERQFDLTLFIEAINGFTRSAEFINLLMLWSFKATSASLQKADRRLGYDAPELWPWLGNADECSFDLLRFNPAYFDRLRELVRAAADHRMAVLITVHDGWPKTCFEAHPFNRALGNGPLRAKEQYVEFVFGRWRLVPRPRAPLFAWRGRTWSMSFIARRAYLKPSTTRRSNSMGKPVAA